MEFLNKYKQTIVTILLLILVIIGISMITLSVIPRHPDYEEYKSLQQESEKTIDSLQSSFSDRILLLNSYYNDAIHKAKVNDMEIESLIVEKYEEIHYLKEQQNYLIELEKHNLQEYTEYWHTQYK